MGVNFQAALAQPAFLAVRLDAGPLPLGIQSTGAKEMDRVVFTPLPAGNEVGKRFLAFEKRSPRLGVHLGLRRDCGSSLVPVGTAQDVGGEKLSRYVFEGAIRNFPSPSVEKDNVNYLAGVREIGVRSEYTDGRDIPRLLIRSVEFEGPYYEAWPPPAHRNIFVDFERKSDLPAYARKIVAQFRDARLPAPRHSIRRGRVAGGLRKIVGLRTLFRGEYQRHAAGGADVTPVSAVGGEEQDAGA